MLNRLGSRRTTKAPQRRNQSSRNPLRALAARTDLKNEYVDVTTGVAERVMKMTNVEKRKYLLSIKYNYNYNKLIIYHIMI